MNTKQIKITDYNYPLPSDRIAKFPLQRRDSSKLLVYRHGNVSEDVFSNLPEYLPEGALMVFNNTKVIQARIHFRKSTGALIEVFLLEPLAPNDYELMFQSRHECSWLCLIGNQKKWKEGSLELEMTVGDEKVSLTATRAAIAQGQEVTFRWDNPKVSFAEIIDTVGELPIPPYLNRATQESDKTTYQTVYSKIKGSVAAPTAGLHFTPEVLARIDGCGIHREEVTLHVGAGTFKPVKSSDIAGHDMHTEHFCVGLHTIEQLLSHHCKAIAVGTTSVRTLETVATDDGIVHPGMGNTSIFITPGVKLKATDVLLTNFHLPESTLLMLVSALMGRKEALAAYREAVEKEYRFFSFGDCMLITGRMPRDIKADE